MWSGGLSLPFSFLTSKYNHTKPKAQWQLWNSFPGSTSYNYLADKHTWAKASEWLTSSSEWFRLRSLHSFTVFPVKQRLWPGDTHGWDHLFEMYHEPFCCSCQLPGPFTQYMNNYPSSAANKAQAHTSTDPFLSSLLYSSSVMCREDSRGEEHQWRADSKLPRCIWGSQTWERKPSRRLDLALVAQSLSCRREERGVMNGLYHTRRPTTAQTNYLTGGFCIGGWPQERACPVFYLFLIQTIAVAHKALRVRWRGMM